MRPLAGVLAIYLLAVLLAGTSPAGSDRSHDGQLLHPAFPHVHLTDGHLVVHVDPPADGQSPQAIEPRPIRPAFAQGVGADAPGIGGGLMPPIGSAAGLQFVRSAEWPLSWSNDITPEGRSEPPALRPPARPTP